MRLQELLEGYHKRIATDRSEDERLIKKIKPPIFRILINGKLWKKNGVPVEFTSEEIAKKARDTIVAKRNIPAQIVEVPR